MPFGLSEGFSLPIADGLYGSHSMRCVLLAPLGPKSETLYKTSCAPSASHLMFYRLYTGR